MSSSITLSAATRQNLLSLQDTASLLSTTQTRLATGKKVNSALDSPTNFFTSQGLTARSGDLSALLDGISNGIQTVQAANQGITSIQKLIDTAKSTAQQALADKSGGSGGVLGGSAAQAAKVTGTATLASLGTAGANGPTFDLSSQAKDASLDISLDGGATKTTIRLDKSTLAASVPNLGHVTSDQLVSAINGQIAGSGALAGKLSAGTSADGRITFTTTAAGAAAQASVAGSANSTLDVGFGKSSTAPTQATVTASAALAASTDFGNGASATLTVSDGTKSVVVSLNKDSATDNLGGKLAPDVTVGAVTTNTASQTAIINAINKKLGDSGSSVVASLGQGSDANKIVFTSADVGPDAQVSVVAGADTTSTGGGATGIGFTTFAAGSPIAVPSQLSLTTATGTVASQSATPGAAAVAGPNPAPATNGKASFSAATLTGNLAFSATQSTSFTVNTKTITINAQSQDASGAQLGTTGVTPAKVVEAINRQLTAAGVTAQASLNAGALVFTDTTTAGAGSTAPTVVTAATGLTDQLGLFSTPATTKLGAALPASIDLSKSQAATFTVGNNGATTAITLNSTTATDGSGGTLGANPNKAQLAAAINRQLSAAGQTTGVSAYVDTGGTLAFTGRDDATTAPALTGVSDTIGLGFGTAASAAAQGQAAPVGGTIDLSGGKSSSFQISAGGVTRTLTINAQSLDKNGLAITASASESKIAEAIQAQLDSTANGAAVPAKVSFVADRLTVTSNAIGTGATATLTALSDTAGLGLGTTAQTSGKTMAGSGTAATAVTASGIAATDGSAAATIAGSTILNAATAVAANGNASFNLTLGSGPTKTINIQGGSTGLSAAALVKSINDQIAADTGLSGNVSASLVNGKLALSTTASGSTQKLTIQTGGSAEIGFGTTTASSGALTGAGTDVGGSKGASSVRQSLAQQFNNILGQISQQARDSSYNGVNLLYRTGSNASENTLHISFNEKNTSALDITGVKFDADGLGLTAATGGFQSDADISGVLNQLNAATTTLRTQSSTFGSNLTVVQNRQDFTKALTNILDTGAANLTNADLNEEAANSQALSTRNSLAISALSLANQAQQGILQLLR